MIEWFFGFHAPWRNPAGWFGHCEAWGYTIDDTWLFLDPQARGSRIIVTHHHDDVLALLEARFARCRTIVRVPAGEPEFWLPLHGPMTCAAICGHLVGLRALLPATLLRKLLANGAEVVHGYAKGREPGRPSGAGA